VLRRFLEKAVGRSWSKYSANSGWKRRVYTPRSGGVSLFSTLHISEIKKYLSVLGGEG